MKRCLACDRTFHSAAWQCPHCSHRPLQCGAFLCFAPGLASDSGFRDEYFQRLFALEGQHFWFQARSRLLLWARKRYFPEATNFLEIGCGTGFVLAALRADQPGLDLSGSELSQAGLPFAAGRVPDAQLLQMDARAIPFSEEFEAIGAFDVLEHVREDEQVLAQLHLAVKPGGGIILTVPQHPWLWSPTDDYACHVRRYTARGLMEKVRAAGFRIIRSTSFVSLLLPFMILSRLSLKTRPAIGDPLSELRVNPLLNSIFAGIMRAERAAIQGGLNFPAGGSFLLIAKKPL